MVWLPVQLRNNLRLAVPLGVAPVALLAASPAVGGVSHAHTLAPGKPRRRPTVVSDVSPH